MERVTADKFFMNLERALMAQADAAGVLSSSTGKGSAREQLLGDTLDSCLPNRLQVERGEVVDGNGLTTGETDLVLVDSNRGSRVIGGESVIPVEAAIAVVEVKSSLRGGELESAVKKIARVKALTRGPHTGIYNFSDATEPRIAVPPTKTLGVIFGYTAPKGTTILKRLGDNPSWYDRDFMEFGPDVIAVPRKHSPHEILRESVKHHRGVARYHTPEARKLRDRQYRRHGNHHRSGNVLYSRLTDHGPSEQ